MESLFARHVPKRGRVALMLAGSLVLHGGLVGIGALFVQPPPPSVEEWFPIPTDEGPTPISVQEPAARPDIETGPTATPENVDATPFTPPPVDVIPPFAEPATPPPARQKVAVKPMTATRTATARTASASATALPGSGLPGGTNGSPGVRAMPWVMPHPPFPAFARQSITPGMTRLRITTDAAGRVTNVVVEQSTGKSALDAYTVSYVRENWRGPANAARTTEFVYQIR